jgi:hypothetical protein
MPKRKQPAIRFQFPAYAQQGGRKREHKGLILCFSFFSFLPGEDGRVHCQTSRPGVPSVNEASAMTKQTSRNHPKHPSKM